ncbi:NAD(P)-dependent oxidoreductase [Sporolactobacillus spathodeae]|uniref:3-hydroxyisobutyrate dehydrogenase-like beta-hydroxyacid dehydrogenase n=1 Tax=Sporolactobacillus spathodeae TaxID=1465502 RepID=A0ABS2QA34_9BACL|nr:NAD(P)-dependent oxidoreductase [Sporolactobacillus spathodeae]MBM7658619.1 3-hydroxyisobutyrate dehydrogenase-like beta-hydroxyacid dehydrogenase [Sporolactobacillus spathodeae]
MIGFIGLGIMGSRMAGRLQNAGQELVVFNRTKAKAEPLLANGAQFAESPRAVGEQAAIVFTMLANPQAVDAVAYGTDGLLRGMKPGSLWVDSSTISPTQSRRLAEDAAAAGVHFLDAPVAGSTVPAEKGELIFFVGGNVDDLEKVRPLLLTMGKEVQHKGDNGMGTAMKLVNNLLLAQSIAAFSEAVAFGESLGLEKKELIRAITSGPNAAPVLNLKKGKLLEGDFEAAQFKVDSIYKDLELASEEAYVHHFALPLSNNLKAMFGLAQQYGMGSHDIAAIYAFLKK